MNYLKDFDLTSFYEWASKNNGWSLKKTMKMKCFYQIHSYLDFVAIEPETSLGKEVYFGVNQKDKNELSYDISSHGISIIKGIVENVEIPNEWNEVVVTINNNKFVIDSCFSELCSSKEHAILRVDYDWNNYFRGKPLPQNINLEELIKIEC